MANEPENLILREIRDLRREHLGSQESLAASLRHLKSFADAMDRLTQEFDAYRTETRAAFRELRSDLLMSDNASLNRHNDLLRAMERLRALESVLVGEGSGSV